MILESAREQTFALAQPVGREEEEVEAMDSSDEDDADRLLDSEGVGPMEDEDEEFFVGKRKRSEAFVQGGAGGKQSAIYGVFYEDPQGERRGRGRGGGRERGKGGGASSKPIGFVSSGAMNEVKSSGEEGKEQVDAESSDPAVGRGGLGLGFGGGGGGGLGFEGRSTDFGDFSFGKKILEAAGKRREKKAQTQRGRGKGKAEAANVIGSFEKHTKGIGMKLLQKMGYEVGKGLGKGKQGIAAPVEAKVRPKGMALGFGEPQEEPEPVREEPRQAVKPAVTQPANLWKKSKKAAREKIRYKTAEELLVENAEAQASQTKIIDMRGPQSRVLTKLERINEVPMDALVDKTPMPELQYNMRLVVDLAESELHKVDHEIRQQKEIAEVLKEKISRIESSQGESEGRFQRLRELTNSVSLLMKKKESLTSLDSVRDVVREFEVLRKRYPDEFVMYNVGMIASSIIYATLEKNASAWQPLEECNSLRSVFEQSRAVLGSEGSNVGLYESDDLTTEPYSILLKETICFQLHRYIRNEWNPLNPDEVILFLSQWAKAFSSALKSYVLNQMILPRLRVAVDDWEPTRSSVPIHVWIHPWLPYLSEELQEFYPLIRQKISRALKSWHPSDSSALSLIKPWKPVFDSKAWEKFTYSNIVPKLEDALSSLRIDRKDYDTSKLKWVLSWSECLSSNRICRLLSKGFFPKLHKTLYDWLGGDPDFEQVAEWYEDWKSVFPQELEAQEEIRIHFNRCLLMMNAAVSGEDLQQYNPSSDREQYEPAAAASGPATSSLRQAEFHATLKDLVESFSMERGVEFFPKVGRFNKSLQIYSFGGISVTLDNRRQVIEAFLGGKWVNVSLERLLSEEKAK